MSSESAQKLIKAGSDLAGAAVGGALGFLAGDTLTAAVGAMAGGVVTNVLTDVSDRVLSAREKMRVGATAAIAIEHIRKRVDQGEKLRQDGFFEKKSEPESGKSSSQADEIFEGVLLKAKNDHEEKKIKHLGKLFANVAFDPWCSPAEANYLLRLAETMTYTQMVLLKIAHSPEAYRLRNTAYQEGEQVPYKTVAVLESILEAHHKALIQFTDKGHHLQINSINPSTISFGVVGKRFFEMLSLREIPDADVEDIRRSLSADRAEVFQEIVSRSSAP